MEANLNTDINPSVQEESGNETVVNTEILSSEPGFTEINPIAHGNSTELSAGTVLCGKYVIQEILHQNSGEAVLYLCTYRNRQYVAKIYRRAAAIKEEVIEALNSVTSPYVAKLYETGFFEGAPFEVLPYYKYGSLEGKTFSFETIENVIIPELNAGLHALHKKDIIHKDLKPANIMLCDNQTDIAIIDFGISSIREDGNTVVMTRTGMTPEYSASETFRNLFLEESDYYSLGITLFELFCGRTPYEGMSKDSIEQFVSVQKIPFPEEMPERLKELITGLTYNDITNRKDKNNPNRRWTYTEVVKWCRKETLPLPGGSSITAPDIPIQPYTFYRKKYYRLNELAYAMAENWENGKKHLYRSTMSEFFKANNPDLANCCIDAEESVRMDRQKADISFFRVLYQMAPEMKDIFWKSVNYGPIEEMGRNLMKAAEMGADESIYTEMTRERVFSSYFSSVSPEQSAVVKGVEAGEQKFINSGNQNERILSIMLIGRYLAREASFSCGEETFDTLEAFAEYLLNLRKENPEQLERTAKGIIKGKRMLHPSFESWLILLGKSTEIAAWRERK